MIRLKLFTFDGFCLSKSFMFSRPSMFFKKSALYILMNALIPSLKPKKNSFFKNSVFQVWNQSIPRIRILSKFKNYNNLYLSPGIASLPMFFWIVVCCWFHQVEPASLKIGTKKFKIFWIFKIQKVFKIFIFLYLLCKFWKEFYMIVILSGCLDLCDK